MEVSQIILCSILCVSLMVALSDSAPLQHSLMKRHAFQQNTQGKLLTSTEIFICNFVVQLIVNGDANLLHLQTENHTRLHPE